MTARRELPIAPRPENDELLSSWQGRVACRYGLVHDELSRWLGVLGDDRHLGFAERDFAPSIGKVQAWSTACRLPEERVQGLALCSWPRSLSWYVWGEGRAAGAFRRPVCLECLDEDAAAGRDHHVRRSWALVETVSCERHHRMLEEACPHCLGGSGFRFVFRDAAARLACIECGRRAGVAGSRCRGGSEEPFVAMSKQIASAIADRPDTQDRVMDVARMLWKHPRPRTGRRTPFVADVVPDLRLLPSVGLLTDRAEPLATAPIGWRMVTLLGVAALLDLGGSLNRLASLTFTLDRMVEWTEEPHQRPKELRARLPIAARQQRGRSDADYLALARSILASKEWRVAQSGDQRAQRRVLNKLIDKALAEERSSSSGLAGRATGAGTRQRPEAAA